MRLTQSELMFIGIFIFIAIVWFNPLTAFVGTGILLGIFYGFKI